MKPATESNAGEEAKIRDIAAHWVVRQDRRLSASEVVELEKWRVADPRHAAALERSGMAWSTLRGLAATVRRAAESPQTGWSRWPWPITGMLAAAAAVTLAFISFERGSYRARVAAAVVASAPTSQRFADGSVARFKRGGEITHVFTPTERRLRLVRGEAFFSVAKDASRPFYVEIGSVTVRAVGTAFAISFDPQSVGVLVTEGTVQVIAPGSDSTPRSGVDAPGGPALVGAGHRAVVTGISGAQVPTVVVSAVSADEMDRTLAWSEPMLELAGATLGELVVTFSARTGWRIEIGDPALADVRIGGRFPPDNVDGFLRALEEIYDVKSEQRPDGVTVLRKAK